MKVLHYKSSLEFDFMSIKNTDFRRRPQIMTHMLILVSGHTQHSDVKLIGFANTVLAQTKEE